MPATERSMSSPSRSRRPRRNLYSEICSLMDSTSASGCATSRAVPRSVSPPRPSAAPGTTGTTAPRPGDARAAHHDRGHTDRPHVFRGNTRDSTTLPVVAGELSKRCGVGRLCLVADRGIITRENLGTLSEAGIDYVLATRLHPDRTSCAKRRLRPRSARRPNRSRCPGTQLCHRRRDR
jgi:hypothetical protein